MKSDDQGGRARRLLEGLLRQLKRKLKLKRERELELEES